MSIISIQNPKGGSGKTTLATNLAAYYANVGRSVLLIDADQQASAREWHAARDSDDIAVMGLDTKSTLKQAGTHAQHFDVTIIDGSAKLEELLAPAISVADLVLIPVTPSPYDIWAVGDLVDIIRMRQEVSNGQPKAAFIISRAIKNTVLGREVIDAVDEYGLTLLDSGTTQRQPYVATAAEGKAVSDGGYADLAAEIKTIADEIDVLMGSK